MYSIITGLLLVTSIMVLTSAIPIGQKNMMETQDDTSDSGCYSTLDCIRIANEEEDLFEVDILSTKQLQDAIDNIKSKYNGDQITEQLQGEGQQNNYHLVSAQAMSGIETMKWPNGIVPYTMDPNLEDYMVQWVTGAIKAWENVTCIRFIPREDSHGDSVWFSSARSCSSYVGRIIGEQPIFVGGCNGEGTVVHEIGHALGFWHEQSRPDRNEHVKINWENIRPGKEYNFYELSGSDIDSGGVPYDPHSIMQYSSYAFTANGEPTIVMEGTNDLIYTADHLSVLDILQANIAYNCAELNCSAHSDDDNRNSSLNINSTNSFMIQNIANGKCLSPKEYTGQYISSDSVDSLWAVTIDHCNPQNQSQYWVWSSKGSWIIHKDTGSCISLSSTGILILADCSGPLALQFLCAGLFIEHPSTEQCLTANNLVSIPQTVTMATSQLEHDLLNSIMMTSSNEAAELAMSPCNISNPRSSWRIYVDGPSSSSTFDEPVCDSQYQLDECYNHTSLTPHGWMRCDVHGYFISEIHFRDDLSRVVSSIRCCRSPYSYWGHIHTPILLDHTQFTCRHIPRVITSTESVFRCLEDEYMRGILINTAPNQYYYSLIGSMECCHPLRDRRVYRHCHIQDLSNDVRGCLGKGYFITSLTEVVPTASGSCDKTVSCCV